MTIKFPTEKDIGAMRSLWREAFGDGDEYIDVFFSTAYKSDRCLVGLIDEALAGALYWFDCEYGGGRVAYLYAVATFKEYRGRGVCRALMSECRRLLESLGYVGALLVPGEAGLFDMYSRLGYSVCSEVAEFVAYPSGRVTKIREITPEEYARARRELLPPLAVLQEGENIGLLSSLYKLYRGDGFLLAAVRAGDKLICAELLGDRAKAADILTSLGCSEGKFRTVGKGRPFAMWRGFCDTPAPVPSYFGLAFD